MQVTSALMQAASRVAVNNQNVVLASESSVQPQQVKDNNQLAQNQIQKAKNPSILSFPSFVDIMLRAPFRFFESTFFTNPVSSALFRLGSEGIRHTTTGAIREAVENKPLTRTVWVKGARSAVENTLGKIAFDTNVTNVSDNKLITGAKRALKGFANIAVRLAFRLAMAALDLVDADEIEPEAMLDEVAHRSYSRVFCLPSDNPVFGIGSRMAEQALINIGLERLPFKQLLIDRLKGTKNNNNLAKEPQVKVSAQEVAA